jgi:hypothetical protein
MGLLARGAESWGWEAEAPAPRLPSGAGAFACQPNGPGVFNGVGGCEMRCIRHRLS